MDQFSDIAETYDWTEQSTDDIFFYVAMARQAKGCILELGAGTGRVTIPVAEIGKPVTAIDISESMLSRARSKAKSRHIKFKVGDFRELSSSQTFGLVLAPSRVFEHAVTATERNSAFAGVTRYLQQSGILALHVWGPPVDTNPKLSVKTKFIESTDEHGTLKFSWREERDFRKELRKHHFRIEETDGQRRTWAHDPIEIRWYNPETLDALGQAVGLKVCSRSRDFHGNPYQPGFLNMIWVYEKD